MSTLDTDALLKWGHDDYGLAREQILTMLGDLSGMRLFGRNVLVADYIRPNRNEKTGVYIPTEIETKRQREDEFQGKIVLIVKCGPSAFKGDQSYLDAMFDGVPPKVGDWVMLAAQNGLPTKVRGDGARRVTFINARGVEEYVFAWDGWPCRCLVNDEQLIGGIDKPHTVV